MLRDDLRGLGPYVKFGVQAVAATMLYAGGLRIVNIPVLFGNRPLPWFVGLLFTVIWVREAAGYLAVITREYETEPEHRTTRLPMADLPACRAGVRALGVLERLPISRHTRGWPADGRDCRVFARLVPGLSGCWLARRRFR